MPRACKAGQADGIVQAAQHAVPVHGYVRGRAPAVAHLQPARRRGSQKAGSCRPSCRCQRPCRSRRPSRTAVLPCCTLTSEHVSGHHKVLRHGGAPASSRPQLHGEHLAAPAPSIPGAPEAHGVQHRPACAVQSVPHGCEAVDDGVPGLAVAVVVPATRWQVLAAYLGPVTHATRVGC